jgi:hypothetical protein
MTTWNTATGATVGDRLLNTGDDARHLSTAQGVVFLDYDPGLTAPNQVSLKLAANHTSTPTVIASISSTNFSVSGVPQALALALDSSDNIYVVGQDNGSDTDTFGFQAFKKGAGYTWTAEPYISPGPDATEGNDLSGFAVVWCNTGGGTGSAGHLFIICDDTTGNDYVCIVDAGKVLTGTQSGAITKCTQNPAFMGAGSASAAAGSNLDLSANGFGASSGLAISGTTTTTVTVGAWGVTTSGALTTGGGLVHTTTTGTLSTTTKTRLVRQSANLWAAVYRSTGTPAQLSVQTFSSSALLGTLAALGTPSNFPAQGASLSWAVCAGPTSPTSLIWIFGWSTLAANLDSLLRLSVNATIPSTPTVGTVVTDNASVSGGGASADMSTLRIVKEPIDALHIDWQAYKSTTTYGLYGYYTALPASPSLPWLTSPGSGSINALSGGNLTLAWLFQSGVVGDAQTGAYVRRQLSGSGYQWWNGASWTAQQAGATGGSEIVVSGLTTAQSVSASTWTAAAVYSYSVQTIGATGLLSGYASAVSFVIANVAPATPTLTANYSATTNITTLTLHSGDATGPTGSIEFSDDGGVTWTFVRFCTALVINPGTSTAFDEEAPSGATRQYRARSWTGYPTSYSAYATATATPAITQFWLRDVTASLGSVNLMVLPGSLSTKRPEASTQHQGLGNPAAIVVADVIGLEDGQGVFWTLSASDEAALQALLLAQYTLLLQAPDNRQWWIRVVGDRPTDVPYLYRPGTYRQHAIVWRGQARPS